MKSPRQMSFAWRAGLALIGLLLLIWAVDLGWNTYRLLSVYRQGRALAQAGWQNVPVEDAGALLARAYPPMRAVRRDVRPLYPLLSASAVLPRVGPLLSQVEPGLEAGTELLRAGTALWPLVEGAWSEEDGQQAGRLERLVHLLQQDTAGMAEASQALERAVPYVQRLRPEAAPENLRDNLAALQSYAPLMQSAARLLPDLPALLGADRPRTYLVLGQNNDELRATGGFISAIGYLTLDGGRVAAFELPDSYSVDNFAAAYPEPPEALRRYMLAGLWLPRDANWSPDFPTAAQQAQALVTLSNGSVFDGVVAFDQAAIQELVGGLGSVVVEGYQQPLNRGSVAFAMRSAWNPGEGQEANNAWYANRKNFMSDMGKAILRDLMAMRSPDTLRSVLLGAVDSLRAGHLLIYLNDPAAQAELAAMGLDGGVRPGQGDFLMLVDWNFGYNKVDPLVMREVEYLVDLRDPQQPQATVTLRYTHTLQEAVACRHESVYGRAYEDMQRRCFWNYWRVYAPPGARLIAAQAPPLPGSALLNGTDWDGRLDVASAEGGAQVFGGPLLLPAAGQAEIVLTYALPAGVLQTGQGDLMYRLRLQKQAGLARLPVRVQVLPPDGYRAESLASVWLADGGTAVWQADVVFPQDLALRFTR